MDDTTHAADWGADAPSPAQLKEFFAQIDKGRVTKKRLQEFLRTPDDISAQQGSGDLRGPLVLGDDFISPHEVANARGLSYSPEQLRWLSGSVPPSDVLRSLRDDGFALVAGPPEPMSLLNVRDVNPALFNLKSGGWYAKDNQRFAHKETVDCTWIAIRKTIVPNSTSKTWNEQVVLLGKDETVPNGATFAWFVTTYEAVRNVCLFGNVYARVRSVAASGSRVRLGSFGRCGLGVHCYWDDDRFGGIGLAASRKV